MKVCTNCKHHEKLVSDWCHVKRYREVSIVTGEARTLGIDYCSSMRKFGECGPEAKLHEVRPSLWTRFKRWFQA